MRHLRRTLAVCALAALAIGVAGAASASATEYPLTGLPEIGRCVKASPAMTGEYKRGKCVTKSPTNTGEYNWLPGPGAKPGIKPRILSPTLETVTGKKIKCTYIFLEESTIADSKEVKAKKLTGQGCEMVGSGLPCFSNPNEVGTISSTVALNGEIGFIPGSKTLSPWVGLDLKPESEVSKTLFEFFCGEQNAVPQYQVSIEGSVIGRVKPVNKMVEGNFQLIYKQAGGVQIPTAFKEGVEDVLTQITTPTANPLGKKEEQVGLASYGEIQLEEPVEIRNRQK